MRKGYILAGILIIIISVFYLKNDWRGEINLCAAGDILLDRGVRQALTERDYNYPYERVKDILTNADIAFANLECPITERGTPVYKRRELVFKGDPENAQALKRAGFDILNLANNHTMDYESAGLSSTLNILREAGIAALGAGLTRAEASKPVLIKKGDCLVGFLGYTVFPPEGYISLAGKPDVARVDYKTIEKKIKEAKKKCDFLVVSFHWGKEYDFFPSEDQKELAHMAVDCGADLVIGHHPHVLQGVETYKGKLIFFSLGNFIFDRQLQSGTDETIILYLTIENRRRKEARLIPVKIVDCRPQIATGSEAEHILKRLQLYSEGMNTGISIKGGRGYIYPEK